MKPEKVKSRWRRNSEMETQESNSVAPVNNSFICTADNNDLTMKSKTCPNFENIDGNLYLFERKKTKRKKEVRRMLCECTLADGEEIGCGDKCLNRLLMIECSSRCPTGDACSNRRFQKKEYVKTEKFITEKKGFGLRVLEEVPRGSFIMEYVGEVLNTALFKQRVKLYAREKQGEEHYYFMALRSGEILDARNKGNLSRFINHSCLPNCETQKWTVNGDLRIGFFARRDIRQLEELTFDYQLQRYGREAQKCFCGSENCKGYIGVSDEITVETESSDASKKESRNRKLKRSDKDEKRKDLLEEVVLEEEIDKLCINGLRNKEDSLSLARLMVQAEDAATREKLLDIIMATTEMACLRLFLDYHGLTILMCWMADVTDDNLKAKILQTLTVLPVPNKNMLIDSKVFSHVEKWAYPKKERDKREEREDGDSSVSVYENPCKKIKSCDTSDSETDGSTLIDISVNSLSKSDKGDSVPSNCDVLKLKTANTVAFLSDEEQSSDNKASDNNVHSDEESPSLSERERDTPHTNKTESVEVENLAKYLLLSWKDLKEEFRIPRRVDRKDEKDTLNGGKKDFSEREKDERVCVNTHTKELVKGGKADEKSSFSLNEEKTQQIKVVCPNFPRKYSHSSPRLSLEDRRSHFGFKMQHRRNNFEKTIIYPPSQNIEYNTMDNESYQYPNVCAGRDKTMNNESYQYPNVCAGRDKSLHYNNIYQPTHQPPPRLLPAPGTSPSAICTMPPQSAETVYAPTNNVLYPPPNENNNFKIPPPSFLSLPPPPTVAREHTAPPMFANSNVPPPTHLMNLGVNSPIVPMQVNDPVYRKEPEYTNNKFLYDKKQHPREMYIPPTPSHTFQASQQPQQTYPPPLINEEEKRETRTVPIKLPPNWRTATDADGNVYFYHAIKRESRWDPPTPEATEVDGTPTYDEPKTSEHFKHEKSHSRRSHTKHSKRGKSTTTAPADTSSQVAVNNEIISKKIKELFRTKMSTFVIQCLNPYRKDDCRVAKITSNNDFKYLARKLTHFVMAKELKHCKHVEDLDANNSVKFKARDYIHKYMARFGPIYRKDKDKCDSLGDV